MCIPTSGPCYVAITATFTVKFIFNTLSTYIEVKIWTGSLDFCVYIDPKCHFVFMAGSAVACCEQSNCISSAM